MVVLLNYCCSKFCMFNRRKRGWEKARKKKKSKKKGKLSKRDFSSSLPYIIKVQTNYTYKISNWPSPLSACSSKHVIWLWSSCILFRDGAPLRTLRPIVVIKLWDKSLQEKRKKRLKNQGFQIEKTGKRCTYNLKSFPASPKKLSGNVFRRFVFKRLH